MNVCFTGLNEPIIVGPDAVSVLEVQNRVLFCRLCSSLVSERGSEAEEPYTFWSDDGEEIKPEGRILFVLSPLSLPWTDKALSNGLSAKFERLVNEDEDARQGVEYAFACLKSRLSEVALSLESEYAFEIDWELKRYLRTYGFGVELIENEPLLDKLIKFLALAKDVSLSKVLLFANLKLFLSENELRKFYEQAFFSGLSVLLIENVRDGVYYEQERKYVIDQDLLESW